MSNLIQILKGGSGSGDFGHIGRAGRRGGSGGGGGKGKPRKGRRSREALNKEIERDKKRELLGFTNSKVTDVIRDSESNDTTTNDKYWHRMEHIVDEDIATTKLVSENTVDNINYRTNVDKKTVRDFIRSWNGGDVVKRNFIAHVIQEELGIEQSPYEKRNQEEWTKSARAKKLFNDENRITDYKKIARAVYEETQRVLSNLEKDAIIAYRAVNDIESDKKGSTMKWHANSIDSWTSNKEVAEGFDDVVDVVLKSLIPRNRIFSFSGTGPGTSFEREIIVLGNGPSDEVLIEEKF